MVLIIKNARPEGPGSIGDFLRRRGIPTRVVEAGNIARLASLDGYDVLVVMGGPMAAYEMHCHPHLRAGARLIQEALRREIKLLGVCLGAQMIARCLGARVYKGHVTEVGWMDVELTPEGLRDPAARSLAGDDGRRVRVFQWHGDTFDLPAGATRLARSDVYENQAFRYGTSAYALQFHVEVTQRMIERWFRGMPGGHHVAAESRETFRKYRERAKGFYRGFFLHRADESDNPLESGDRKIS